MPDSVRGHSRRNRDGSTSYVRNHSRKSRPRRGLVSPAHAWNLAKGAFRAGRRKKRGVAAILGTLAILEIGAWLTLQGTSLLFTTAGALALGVASVAAAAGGR